MTDAIEFWLIYIPTAIVLGLVSALATRRRVRADGPHTLAEVLAAKTKETT